MDSAPHTPIKSSPSYHSRASPGNHRPYGSPSRGGRGGKKKYNLVRKTYNNKTTPEKNSNNGGHGDGGREGYGGNGSVNNSSKHGSGGGSHSKPSPHRHGAKGPDQSPNRRGIHTSISLSIYIYTSSLYISVSHYIQ